MSSRHLILPLNIRISLCGQVFDVRIGVTEFTTHLLTKSSSFDHGKHGTLTTSHGELEPYQRCFQQAAFTTSQWKTSRPSQRDCVSPTRTRGERHAYRSRRDGLPLPRGFLQPS